MNINKLNRGTKMGNKIIILGLFILFSVQINGQILKALKEKVKEKTTERAEQKVDEGIDEGLNSLEEAAVSNPNGTVDSLNSDTLVTPLSSSTSLEFKTYSKFDFISGEDIIFCDDFSDVPIGDFPLKWNTTASGEIVTLNTAPGKWFKLMEDYSYYAPELKYSFPKNFTIEFDAIFQENTEWVFDLYTSSTDYLDNEYYPGEGGLSLYFLNEEVNLRNYSTLEDGDMRDVGNGILDMKNPGEIVRYSIWGQNQRLRVYQNEKKVLDIPRAIPNQFTLNAMRIGCLSKMIIGNFRFAVGAPDTRNRLLTEGRFITYGITFDSASDKIRPESYGVLKEIAAVLNENRSMRVRIIGHTDSDGANEFNIDLSKKRAAAVKTALENNFGVLGSNLEITGKGEEEPISPNDTPEGKAKNRRVEFVKIS
jgi:outer membrane protein OmpA-like peptidoglycan-associated protein